MSRKYNALCLLGGAIVGVVGLALWEDDTQTSEPPSPAAIETAGRFNAPMVWTDPDTSCQYLLAGPSGRGITPRLHSDGVQVCMGEDNLGAQLPDYRGSEQP